MPRDEHSRWRDFLAAMKKLLLTVFLFSLACARGQQQTIDLGSHGRLTFYLLGDWKVEDRTIADRGEIEISPKKESVNASCKIEISFPDADRFDTKSRLKLRVEADCKQYEEESVEGKAYAKEFSLSVPGAYGFYCSFTDSALRNQPSQPGNYKVVSAGKIRLSRDVLLDVFIGADAFRDETYQQLLGALEGMEFTPGKG
jgi:hypothetical protein